MYLQMCMIILCGILARNMALLSTLLRAQGLWGVGNDSAKIYNQSMYETIITQTRLQSQQGHEQLN